MPPWNDIDTVMFDMDGTLLDLHFDNYFWQHLLPLTYAEQNRIAHDEAIAFVTAKSERVSARSIGIALITGATN